MCIEVIVRYISVVFLDNSVCGKLLQLSSSADDDEDEDASSFCVVILQLFDSDQD